MACSSLHIDRVGLGRGEAEPRRCPLSPYLTLTRVTPTAAAPPLPPYLSVRGFLLNFGVYHAARSALGLPFAWNPSIT